MDLYILDGPKYEENPLYRGVDRCEPTYHDSFPVDHEINLLFTWYIGDLGGGPVHDLKRAYRYAELCNKHFIGRHFELVEVTYGKAAAESNGKFLGYDLYGFGGSLLAMGALAARAKLSSTRIPEPIWVLSELAVGYFGPKLNNDGLFQDFEAASYCLRCFDALQRLCPGLYESDPQTDLSGHRIIRVYLLPEPGGASRLSGACH